MIQFLTSSEQFFSIIYRCFIKDYARKGIFRDFSLDFTLIKCGFHRHDLANWLAVLSQTTGTDQWSAFVRDITKCSFLEHCWKYTFQHFTAGAASSKPAPAVCDQKQDENISIFWEHHSRAKNIILTNNLLALCLQLSAQVYTFLKQKVNNNKLVSGELIGDAVANFKEGISILCDITKVLISITGAILAHTVLVEIGLFSVHSVTDSKQ